MSKDDLENRDIQEKLKMLDNSIHQRIGDYTKSVIRGAEIINDNPYHNIFMDDEEPHPVDA